MIDVRPVVQDDLGALFDLTVTEAQKGFVAPNAITLAEAAYDKAAYVFAIWAGDTRVGLIALVDITECEDAEPDWEPTSILIWRLMIGTAHQGRGYGTAAIEWAFDWARARGRPRMSIEVVETNSAAMTLYERMGFRKTGVMFGDEAQMARDL